MYFPPIINRVLLISTYLLSCANFLLADDECHEVGTYLFLRIGEIGKQTSNIKHNVLYYHCEGVSRTLVKHQYQHIFSSYCDNILDISNSDITNKFY